jgi:hypothetical protein
MAKFDVDVERAEPVALLAADLDGDGDLELVSRLRNPLAESEARSRAG